VDDAHLVEAVGFFASDGLRQGEAVMLIMAAAHRQPIRQRLGREGFNPKELESTGQLVCANAEELISQFLVVGNIYEQRFEAIFGAMIEQAKAHDGKRRPVRVFGETVDLLWHSERQTSAVKLPIPQFQNCQSAEQDRAQSPLRLGSVCRQLLST
jgi:hypothetical protein